MVLGSGRRRGEPTLEDTILLASTRGPGARTRAELTPPSGRHLVMPPEVSGTVLAIDIDALVALAAREDLFVALERRAGEFAVAATPLLSWWSAVGTVPDEAEERRIDAEALDAVVLGPGPGADVDSRLRALAATGDLDALSSALALLARVPDPPAAYQDPEGFLRVIAPESPFERRLTVLSRVEAPAEALLLVLRDCAFTATLPRRRAAIAALAEGLRASDPSAQVEELAVAVDAALEKRWSVA